LAVWALATITSSFRGERVRAEIASAAGVG